MLSTRKILSLAGLLIVFFTTTLSAQTMQTNYTEWWKKIDSLIEKKGLYRSALGEVEKLYRKAITEKQDAQQVKALVYKLDILEELEEFSDTLAIRTLQQESTSGSATRNAIIQVLLADYYRDYYSNNRWEILDQTNTRNYQKTSVRTWGPADFQQAIDAAYQEALKQPAQLQATSLEKYEPIIIKGNARKLRPTLFDLLSWRAIDFYEREDFGILRPSDAFRMNDARYLESADVFSKLSIQTTDSGSHHFKALLVYQRLIAFRLKDPDPQALVDADLHRIRFVYENGSMPDKDKWYTTALEKIFQKHQGHPAADEAAFLLASYYTNAARPDHRKALSLCDEVIKRKNDSQGYIHCYNLALSIRQPSLQITTEKVNLPGLPFRSLVKWKNLDKVHLRIIKADPSIRESWELRHYRYDSAWWSGIVKHQPLKTWEQAVPGETDFLEHSTEIPIEALPAGEYILLAGSRPDMNPGNTHLSAVYLHVSSISYVKQGRDYFVLDRNTGKPLPKAGVQTWYYQYDYNTRKQQSYKGTRYIANEQGYLKLEDGKNRNISLEINYHDDHLFLMDKAYHTSYSPVDGEVRSPEEYEAKNSRVFFFTDRSIYRPGQTLYFKGITVTRNRDTRKSKLYAGQRSVVLLYNANGEVQDSLELTTNAYGSYSGQFTLPETGLTGSFRLEDKKLHGNAYVQVEEYKRPKFYVEYEPVKGSYRVHDTVTVKGTAKAYAGNPVNNAEVTYRVTRRARFPYPWRIWGWPVQRESQEIRNGKLTTDASGGFTISFNAVPDEDIDKKTDPVFDYEVSVDVTDQNGETRSANTVVPVSYKAILVEINAAQTLNPDSLKQVKVFTRNLSGQFEKASAQLRLSPMKDPGRLVRQRLWEVPDRHILSEEAFLRIFPHDEYRTEADPRTWEVLPAVMQETFTTMENGQLDVPVKKLAAGWYRLEISTIDKYGDTVTDRSHFLVLDPATKKIPVNSYLVTTVNKASGQPGEKIEIKFGSQANEVHLVQQVENSVTAEKEGPFSSRFRLHQLDRSMLTIPVTLSQDDLGGVNIAFFYVKHNRFYSSDHMISVPWLEKELDISVQTWRDKTLPGSEEKWTVQVSGRKGQQLATELLTSLYDASLDQFAPHQWQLPSVWPVFWNRNSWSGSENFSAQASDNESPGLQRLEEKSPQYDELISRRRVELLYSLNTRVSGVVVDKAQAARMEDTADRSMAKESQTAPAFAPPAAATPEKADPVRANIRKDFRETAFFFPQLQSDNKGNFSFSFNMPEALTTWKWQLLAHSKELAMGYVTRNIITQKELMVQPNIPRFLREGDRMEISTKIVNISGKEMTGQAELQLVDPGTGQPVDGWFRNFFPNQYFTVAAGSSELVKFPVEVPFLYGKALTWRIIARSGNISDGEEATIPVLTNRQLVTEVIPFTLHGNQSRTYELKKLKESAGSETLSSRSLTVEFTSNPAWYAVQALNYLADYPYECSEQTFNRLYSNILAAHIVAKMPRIRSVLEKWKTSDTAALLSNLHKNQELKQVLLEETPWVLEANSESEQKKRVAQLFDLVKLASNRNKLVNQLKEMQSPNGGFSWFRGGPDDRYITQYIITGIGHLAKLGAIDNDLDEFDEIVEAALPYLDARIQEDYEKRDKKAKAVNYLNYYAAQYHYMRSFFPQRGIPGQYLAAANHYRKEIQQTWVKGNRMAKAMIALALNRTGDKYNAQAIVKSLTESAIRHEEMGMYWKDNTAGYYWQDAPIETQSLLIEAYSEISKDQEKVALLKTWLLRNKQTNHWQSTRATADACYALLLSGDNWLDAEPRLSVALGKATTVTADKAEAGTGYYKKTIPGSAVFPEMGDLEMTLQAPATAAAMPVWGAVYWQYFEDLDKITPSASPLQIRKQVMVEKLTNSGPVLEPVMDGTMLKVGDKLVVRLELTSDRNMEYVHLRDMRASGTEPVNVISGYRWQGGLGYYESTRDASSNFFISFLPKGSHVMEYSLFVSHTGTFSNGITTLQCMYAPEFTSHSEGLRITVE